ncbi:hypothetical protein GQX74_001748 [Glossina fuscipes]|nr:hypothetical protein GQX74_001748 [Glossina fuscipes]
MFLKKENIVPLATEILQFELLTVFAKPATKMVKVPYNKWKVLDILQKSKISGNLSLNIIQMTKRADNAIQMASPAEGENLGEEAGLEDVSAATELPQPELLESQFVETEDERFEVSSKAIFVSLMVTDSVTLLASLLFTSCSADVDLLQLSYKADLPFSSSTILSFSLCNKFSTAGGPICKGVSTSSCEG